MTRGKIAKIHIVLAQVFSFVFFVELLGFHTVWTFPVAFLLVLTLGLYRCESCGVPMWDKRIIGTRIPVSPNIVDQCSVCSHPFID